MSFAGIEFHLIWKQSYKSSQIYHFMLFYWSMLTDLGSEFYVSKLWYAMHTLNCREVAAHLQLVNIITW